MSYKRVKISPIAYVTHADFRKFVVENSDMEYNDVCDMVHDRILTVRQRFCRRFDYIDSSVHNWCKNDEEIKWMRAFYEAYPEFDEVMFVFDN